MKLRKSMFILSSEKLSLIELIKLFKFWVGFAAMLVIILCPRVEEIDDVHRGHPL